MKRKVKRKLFLMGMAVAASFPAGAWARDADKAPGIEEYGFAGEWHTPARVATPATLPELRPDDEVKTRPTTLLGKLVGLFGEEQYRAGIRAEHIQPGSWRMEMLNSGGMVQPDSQPGGAVTQPVGVAFRFSF